MTNPPTKLSRAKAPGKLILSGEHSVVYQQPAIAMAVNQQVTVNVIPANNISIRFLGNTFQLACGELPAKIQAIKNRYAEYQKSNLDIKYIFNHPSELILLILDNYPVIQGLQLTLHSELPIGCGMGTSAAVIVACFTALNDYFNINTSADDLYQKALAVENFQHGKSSGLDIRISQHGGALFIETGKSRSLHLNIQHFFMINTGKPGSTTGQCVEYVKRYQHDRALWQAFGETTLAFKQALEENNTSSLNQAIRANHKLLTHIGVVPARVQHFIEQIESLGFSAKTSGAGSIQGDNGGMVIAAADNPQPLEALCERLHYKLSPITGEPFGATCY